MLAQEGGRVLAPLPEAFVAEAEVGAGLLDDLALDPGLEHRPLPGDAFAVDDVELGLLERRRATLFFATLTRTRLPIASTPSLSVSMRRMSSRTEA